MTNYRKPSIAYATPSPPNTIKNWIQKYKSDHFVTNHASSISQLSSLRKKLDAELEILNEIKYQCYSQDQASMELIEFGLEKLKTGENQHYERFFELYKQAQTATIFSEIVSDYDFGSKFRLSLLYAINRYASQKCSTTNIIKQLIADKKCEIRRLTAIIMYNEASNCTKTHSEKIDKINWRESGEKNVPTWRLSK